MKRKIKTSRKQSLEEVPADKILHSYKGAAEYLGLPNKNNIYMRYKKIGTMIAPDYYLDGVTPLWKESTLDEYKRTYVDGRSKRRVNHDTKAASDPDDAQGPEKQSKN